MSLAEGQQVELLIEKPASGGRMIARHLGQVVLVRGAIPGERVLAWIEKAEKRLAYAVTREVTEASPDRRPGSADALCGGALYSHIAYPRQLAIKSDVVRDAFARLGRYPLDGPVDVAASPEEGYRMRARFHVHGARVGFYREGTHQLCDAALTRQVSETTMEAATRVAESLHGAAPDAIAAITVTENIAATERAVYLDLAPRANVPQPLLEETAGRIGLRGIATCEPHSGLRRTAGVPIVTDTLAAITAGRVEQGTLRRHAESFFQANRFLLAQLVEAVAQAVPDRGHVVDLYAGVGLFSVALAAGGRAGITAVEGDRASGADLRDNARPYAERLDTHVGRVEDYLASRRADPPAALIVDPPRTGLSKDAGEGILRLNAGRVVYVSCDPATLARDTRRLLDAGYRLDSLRAFDLFPNTPHVESLAVFTRG